MAVILKSCQVPWDVSPTTSGVTLIHSETDVSPECTVVFGGNSRLKDGNIIDVRVAIDFHAAWHARIAPKSDNDNIDSPGFEVLGGYGGHTDQYLDWRMTLWREQELCPDASFYVAVQSDWLEAVRSETTIKSRHYVIAGRDGYVEIIAEGFSWREWLWSSGPRDALTDDRDVFRRGNSFQ